MDTRAMALDGLPASDALARVYQAMGRRDQATTAELLRRLPQPNESESGPAAIEPGCKICGDVGWYRRDVPVDHPDFGKLVPCSCWEAERIAHLVNLSGLKQHETHTLDDLTVYDDASWKMVDLGRRFVVQPRGWLYLWGGPGNGKSLILQAVVNELTARGVGAVYTTFSDLLDLIRDTFSRDAEESYQSRFWRLQRVTVLAVDEFDKINETPWVSELRSKLMDHRYRDAIGGETATLFASNSNPREALPGWICSRVFDRRFTVHHHQGGDVRPAAEWGDL